MANRKSEFNGKPVQKHQPKKSPKPTQSSANPHRRAYHQGARAENTRKTHLQLLATTQKLWLSRRVEDMTLKDVADGAGVSLPTLLRHFRTKEVLVLQAVENLVDAVLERAAISSNTLFEAMTNRLMVFESDAALLLKAIALSSSLPGGEALGQKLRREALHWSQTQAKAHCGSCSHEEKNECALALSIAMDVRCWPILRHERGLEFSVILNVVSRMAGIEQRCARTGLVELATKRDRRTGDVCQFLPEMPPPSRPSSS